jgi:hypothetical protein
LALFMARVLANDPQRATTAHVFAFQADFFYRSFDFHTKKQIGLEPPRDPGASAVRIELDGDFIADQNPYPVQTHLACEVRERHLSGRKFDPKKRVRKGLFDHSFHDLGFSHICARKNSKYP